MAVSLHAIDSECQGQGPIRFTLAIGLAIQYLPISQVGRRYTNLVANIGSATKDHWIDLCANALTHSATYQAQAVRRSLMTALERWAKTRYKREVGGYAAFNLDFNTRKEAINWASTEILNLTAPDDDTFQTYWLQGLEAIPYLKRSLFLIENFSAESLDTQMRMASRFFVTYEDTAAITAAKTTSSTPDRKSVV